MKPLSQATQEFVANHRHSDVKQLALQAAKYLEVDMPTAIAQISGRQAASIKIPSWAAKDELRYPQHLSMEQCSSEATARYKASIAQGKILVDLTGGFGVDCAFLATQFEQVHYVERQTELCEITTNNYNTLSLHHIRTHNSDAIDYLMQMPSADWIMIDPARRDGHGGKTVAISDCEPDVEQLEDLLTEKTTNVLVKLSPMLDIAKTVSTLKHIREIHVVSVANECKELLLVLSKTNAETEPTLHCTNLTTQGEQRFTFNRITEQQATCCYTNKLKHYLYEPNASILKAGGYRSVAVQYGLAKLHPNSHLYTSDNLVEEFPGRIFEVKSYCTFAKKELKRLLGDIKKANLTVRNFPATVAELRKRTKLAEGGDDYLFATTLADEKKILVHCTK